MNLFTSLPILPPLGQFCVFVFQAKANLLLWEAECPAVSLCCRLEYDAFCIPVSWVHSTLFWLVLCWVSRSHPHLATVHALPWPGTHCSSLPGSEMRLQALFQVTTSQPQVRTRLQDPAKAQPCLLCTHSPVSAPAWTPEVLGQHHRALSCSLEQDLLCWPCWSLAGAFPAAQGHCTVLSLCSTAHLWWSCSAKFPWAELKLHISFFIWVFFLLNLGKILTDFKQPLAAHSSCPQSQHLCGIL